MAPSLDLHSMGEQIAEDVAHLDAAHHRVLTKLRIFDEGGGWFKQGFRTCAQWLSWRVGWGLSRAREHVRVASALANLPLIDGALARGELSYCKVRAITRVATPDNEAVLLEQARLTTGYHLEMICRKYASVRRHDHEGKDPMEDQYRRYVTRRDTEHGMTKIEAYLHPDEAAVVWAALKRVAAERCRVPAAAPTNAEAVSAETDAPAAEPTNAGNVSAETNASAAEPATADQVSAESNAPLATDDSGAAGPSVSTIDAHANSATEGARARAPAATAAENVSAETHVPSDLTDLPARAEKTRPAFDLADALVAIAQDIVRGKSRDRSPTEIMISIPLETLQDAHAAADPARAAHADPMNVGCCADGTVISAATARRLACDAGIVPLVEDEGGNILALGRKRRTIPGSMKRALLRRDACCRFPGCRTRVFLEGHHIQHWADGGDTDLSNVVAVCSFHHRFLHEYNFAIELSSDGSVIAHSPDGRRIPDVPSTSNQPADLGWPNIARRNAALHITPTTISTWDGTPVDYVECIDWILRVEERASHA